MSRWRSYYCWWKTGFLIPFHSLTNLKHKRIIKVNLQSCSKYMQNIYNAENEEVEEVKKVEGGQLLAISEVQEVEDKKIYFSQIYRVAILIFLIFNLSKGLLYIMEVFVSWDMCQNALDQSDYRVYRRSDAGPRTLKSAVSQEWSDELSWFRKFRKTKVTFIIFGWVWSKMLLSF